MEPLAASDPSSVGDGRYRLTGRLGHGGMGVVYFGRSLSGRAVAVKVVRPELSTDPGFRRRFAAEVAAARRVSGFHTAPVVDADPEGDPAWLVTAFVPGPTLQEVLNEVGPLPADTLSVLAAGLAEALDAIHRAGVIHRDLKPANIIVAEDGPRVIDFGIARALDDTALTQTGLQIGTPGFLAPEQLNGLPVTPAVDMFALGVVLAQAAGVRPFGDGPSAALHYRVVYEEPDLSTLPEELRELVAACLAKDPAQRPTPSQLLTQLTVRYRSDGEWLPTEATALLPQATSGTSSPAAPDDRTMALTPPSADSPTTQATAALRAVPADTPDTEQPPTRAVPPPVPTKVVTAAPGASALPPGRATAVRPPARRSRRGRLVVGVAVGAVALVAGLLSWHPWAKAGGGGHPTSPATGAVQAAAFPTAPLLIRMDTAPGWPHQCHGVIAQRSSTSDLPKQVVSGSSCDMLPQWSPDRRSFAFTRQTTQETAVWLAPADGSNPRRIAAIAGGRVSWSPDGTRLAVLRKQNGVLQLFVVSIADGSARQITTGTSEVQDPSWSPDGRYIAVSIRAAQGGFQLFLADPSAPGGAPHQVARLPYNVLDAVWSPDGQLLAYTAGTYGKGTQGDIHLIRADGTGDRALVATPDHEMDPNWSADGHWVAFVRGPYQSPVIWAVRLDGSGERKLTTGTVPEGHPAWR